MSSPCPPWTCSRHPTLRLLQGCSSLSRLMSRWGKDQSFPCNQCCPMHLSRKSNSRTFFQLPFSPQIYLPSPLIWAMAVQTVFRTTAPSMAWFHCKKTSLLLQDQGDGTEQINNQRMRPCDTAVDFPWMLPSLTLGKVTAGVTAPFTQPKVTSREGECWEPGTLQSLTNHFHPWTLQSLTNHFHSSTLLWAPGCEMLPRWKQCGR